MGNQVVSNRKVIQVGSNSIHFTQYLQLLKKMDVNVQVIAEEAITQSPYSISKVSFRSLNPISILRNVSQLKHILKMEKPEMIHIHQVNRLAYFVTRAAVKLKVPVLTTAWGSDVLLIPEKNPFFRYMVMQVLRRSDIITADSQDMINTMKKMVPENAYVLLQYGITPVLPMEKKKIIYSNRLHKPLYRIHKVIEYFSEFHQEYQDWKLVLAGTGTETERLKEQVHRLGLNHAVEFVGWLEVEENRRWYSVASFFISIPESDGTSVSMLEAMSAGCVPIVSNLNVNHEWIDHGKNGIIESTQNPIKQATLIDADKAAKTNRKLIEERATRESSLKHFIQLYRNLMK